MSEVFTFAGASPQRRRMSNTPYGGFGRGFGAACPAGFATSSSGYCSGAGATAIQQGLIALGNAVRDPQLMAIKADGIIGPATAAAVNRAFTVHIGAGQAGASLRTGTLSIVQIAAAAASIAELLNREVARRGGVPAGSLPPVVPAGPSIPGVPPPPGTAPSLDQLAPASRYGLYALGGLMLLALGVGVYLTLQRA